MKRKLSVSRKRIAEEGGEMGIGTLIVFIAMVLVAAVAASVLISTAGILQQQAQETGNEAIQEVSTGIVVRNAVGDRYNYSDPSNLSNTINILEITVALVAGSPSIQMEDVMVTINDGDDYASLLFDRTGETTYEAGCAANATATAFSVVSLRDPQGTFDGTGDSNIANVMSYGTVVKIYINLTAIGMHVDPMDNLNIKILPPHGTPTIEQLTVPEVLDQGRYVTFES